MAGRFELGFIGAGNMAEGIVAGVLRHHVLAAPQIIVSDPIETRRQFFVEHFGVSATEDNRRAARESRCLVLSIKPQSFDEVARGFADAITPDHLVISIMAGMSTGRIAAAIGAGRARLVRVMPNLPLRIGAGIAGIYGGEHATADDVALVQKILDAGGQSIVVADESLIDAVTALSGSGPAYFYYMVEAMTAAGIEEGLSPQDARKLAEHACLGAARMMVETGEDPAELRRKVTSKGGTTQAALEHMEKAGVGESIRLAVRAAAQRSRELGR